MNSVCISGYIIRIGTMRQASGDNKVIDIIVSVKKQSYREEKKYDYIKCAFWRNQAEYIAKYGTNGDFIIIQGKLSTSQWEDKDGKRVYETYIVGEDVQIPKMSDTSAKEQSENVIKEEGYLDVGKTTAREVNDIYKGNSNGYEEELPF